MLAELDELNTVASHYETIVTALERSVEILENDGEVDVAEILHTVKAEEKAINRQLIRATRGIEKTYPVQLSAEDLKQIAPGVHASKDGLEQDPEVLLDSAVFVHMLQTGAMGAAQKFVEEYCTNLEAFELHKSVQEGHTIITSLREGALEPAKKWVEDHKDSIDEATILNLRFDLRRYEILTGFLKNHDPHAAIEKARKYLSDFYELRPNDLAELSTALALWRSSGGSTPPVTISVNEVAAKSLEELEAGLRRSLLNHMRLAPTSPLATAYLASVECLPLYAKTARLLQTGATEWTSKTELPMEVPLPRDLQFHPVFVCPVSKEETSAENPPVILPCGHVLSRDSASDLEEYSRMVMETKCPYCPRVFDDEPPSIMFM